MCIKTQTSCSRSSSRERQNELESWMIEQATRESKWVREIVCLLFAIPPQHHHALWIPSSYQVYQCTNTYIFTYIYTIMHAHKMCDSFYNSLILCVCVHSRRYIDEDDNDVMWYIYASCCNNIFETFSFLNFVVFSCFWQW